MIVSFDVIQDISTEKVVYVSARLGEDELLEFEKFDSLEFAKLYHINEQQIIYATILEMGRRGAKTHYFRTEDLAFALPGKVGAEVIEANKEDYGLRVYCGFLRTDLVLLLNGGIKTTQRAQDCPNVGPHFRMAQRIMRALLQAEKNGSVRFTPDGINMDDEFELEI